MKETLRLLIQLAKWGLLVGLVLLVFRVFNFVVIDFGYNTNASRWNIFAHRWKNLTGADVYIPPTTSAGEWWTQVKTERWDFKDKTLDDEKGESPPPSPPASDGGGGA